MTRLAALLALCLLAGCGGTDEPPEPAASTTAARPSATAEPAKPVKRPPVRACYRLAYDDAVAPTHDRAPVPCDREHTSVTFLVGELDAVVAGHLLAVDSARVQEQVVTDCPRAFGRFVGGSVEDRRLSMLRAVWFTPTVEESDEGADWFRCDVIAVAADKRLAPLTGPMAGVLDTQAGRDRYAMCGTAEPGTDGFRRVICSATHSWRALSTIPFPGARYPGEARVRAAGEEPCEAAGGAVADDALNFRWGYEWPSRAQWDAGQTYGICWAPD